MGACGHSNGGRMAYYVFTHSHSFAAMAAGSGTTNILTNALMIDVDGSNKMSWAENGSYGGGLGNLWENKARWLDHTSVLQADHASASLLIFQAKQDRLGGYGQGFEMFSTLRRLGKPAWWLDYDNSSHMIRPNREDDLKDYTIRYTQFFDHFLKGAPAPLWMTKGLPSNLKGIESGYALDKEGVCGSTCKTCQSLHKK